MELNDVFINQIDHTIFESTNSIWNELRLNDPWSVGYVSKLITFSNFSTKEDWESFYYKSGEIRGKNIGKLPIDVQLILNDESLVSNNPNKIYKLDYNFKKLNYNYGRTKKELYHKASILYRYSKEKNIAITESECAEAVRFRTICQTWNGIIIRENNTIKTLKSSFPEIIFKSVKGYFDHKYAVDFEAFFGEKLLFGLQIKPESYSYNKSYILKAKQANEAKNKDYSKTNNVEVLTIISNHNGTIQNIEIINEIKKILMKQ
ncbi:MAG: hypothetical protein R2771_05480 [Saprospiraceae bacterium]